MKKDIQELLNGGYINIYFNVDIRIGKNCRSITFEHQLTCKDLDGFAVSRGYADIVDMILSGNLDDTEDSNLVLGKLITNDIDSVVEDYIKYDLCMEEELKRYLAWIYRDKVYDSFNKWIDDQIYDFGEEYFMLEV